VLSIEVRDPQCAVFGAATAGLAERHSGWQSEQLWYVNAKPLDGPSTRFSPGIHNY
jgi:hypothetical protein